MFKIVMFCLLAGVFIGIAYAGQSLNASGKFDKETQRIRKVKKEVAQYVLDHNCKVIEEFINLDELYYTYRCDKARDFVSQIKYKSFESRIKELGLVKMRP